MPKTIRILLGRASAGAVIYRGLRRGFAEARRGLGE